MCGEIEPYVSTRVKFVHNNRKKEIALTRLRIGKCLNSCLHEITVMLILLDSVIHVMNQKQLNTICSIVKLAVTSAVCELCTKLNISITLSSVLRDFRFVDITGCAVAQALC